MGGLSRSYKFSIFYFRVIIELIVRFVYRFFQSSFCWFIRISRNCTSYTTTRNMIAHHRSSSHWSALRSKYLPCSLLWHSTQIVSRLSSSNAKSGWDEILWRTHRSNVCSHNQKSTWKQTVVFNPRYCPSSFNEWGNRSIQCFNLSH